MHFEPVTGYESRWGDLCSVHRKPVKDRDEKVQRVLEWVKWHIDMVAEMMEKESAENQVKLNGSISNMFNASAASAHNQNYGYGCYGGMGKNQFGGR